MRVKLKAAYDDFGAASDESGLRCEDRSLAQQHFAEEVDINTIVKRFGLTGELPENVVMPTYADFLEVTDFQSAMNAVAKARESFELLPAEWRARFHNDPAEFVDFCSDEANRPEAEKMGLVAARKAAAGLVTTTEKVVVKDVVRRTPGDVAVSAAGQRGVIGADGKFVPDDPQAGTVG